MRSTIESLVKLPLEIPRETSIRSRKEEAKIVSINKAIEKNEAAQIMSDTKPETNKAEEENYSKGYIKYPTYDFF